MALRPFLAWGLVGGLSFLVLLQGYELLAGVRIDLVAKGGVALFVTVVAAALTALVARELQQS